MVVVVVVVVGVLHFHKLGREKFHHPNETKHRNEEGVWKERRDDDRSFLAIGAITRHPLWQPPTLSIRQIELKGEESQRFAEALKHRWKVDVWNAARRKQDNLQRGHYNLQNCEDGLGIGGIAEKIFQMSCTSCTA